MLAAVFSFGCIKNRTEVKVKKDGSGHIVVTRVFSREAVDMMNVQIAETKKRMSSRSSGEFGMKITTPKDPFFNEKAIKKEAKKFGPMVKFVKAKKVESGGAQGYVAVYSFKDINDVFVNLEKIGADIESSAMQMEDYSDREDSESEDEDSGRSEEKGENSIEFKLVKGDTAKLQVNLPELPNEGDVSDVDDYIDGGSGDTAEKDKDADEEEPEEYIEDAMLSPYSYGGFEGGMMMPAMFIGVGSEKEAAKRMYRGMEVTFAIEVEGTVVKTSAAHADPANKNRFFIMDMNLNKMMASPKGAKMIEKSGRYGLSNGSQMFSSMNKIPGAVMETNRQVVVEFK